MSQSNPIHHLGKGTDYSGVHVDPTKDKGVFEGEGKDRDVQVEPKPAGTLTFAQAPGQYLKLSLVHLCGHIADLWHSKDENVYRQAERTVEDPFASVEAKSKAVEDLLSLEGPDFQKVFGDLTKSGKGFNQDPVLKHLADDSALEGLAVRYACKILESTATGGLPGSQAARNANMPLMHQIIHSASSSEAVHNIHGALVGCSVLDASAPFYEQSFLQLSSNEQSEVIGMLDSNITHHHSILTSIFNIALRADTGRERLDHFSYALSLLGNNGDFGAQIAIDVLKEAPLIDSEKKQLAKLIADHHVSDQGSLKLSDATVQKLIGSGLLSNRDASNLNLSMFNKYM